MAEYLDVLRTEKKYQVPLTQAGAISARLSYVMKSDPNSPAGTPYLVKSLYFDSAYDQDYHQKCSGLECRKKIRLRCYGGSGPVKLECKQKQGSVQRKMSLLVTPQEARELMAGRYRCLMERDSELAHRFYALMTERVYRPKCLVQYDRLAFMLPTNDIRVTIDSRIACWEGAAHLLESRCPTYPVQNPHTAILEVKYNHFLLQQIQDALAPFHLTENANSKYLRARHYGMGVSVL